MTLTCSPNDNRGVMTIIGADIPNGSAVLTRKLPGENPWILRDGVFNVTTGGFRKDDSEPPFGVPLKYQLSMTLDVAHRYIQSNRMLTPTFLHGIQGWLAGVGRTATIVADSTAHSAQVGKFSGNIAGTVPVNPPTLVGHIESGYRINNPYTLTPPTSGANAVATGDWMFIYHQQRTTGGVPGTPVGFELVWSLNDGIGVYIWRRQRQAGDTGYTVPAAADAFSIGTLLWVRGASATDPIIVGQPIVTVGTALITVPSITRQRPTLALTFSAASVSTNTTPPDASSVFGSVFQYLQGQGTETRNTLVASFANSNAGVVPETRITYNAVVTSGVGIQIGIQAASPTSPRIIAKGKAALLSASPDPYLMTGRFKFNSSDLYIWDNVYNNFESWAAVKANGSWGALRGATAGEGADFIRLFVGIIDTVSGNYYVEPVQVLTLQAPQMNTWMDFSFYFTTAVDIPTTAEVRFLHGTTTREYTVEWWLDEIGITPGADHANHNNVYWFDGDSTPPTNSVDYLLPPDEGGSWQALTKDSYMAWSGTVGNSVSNWYGPSKVTTSTTCILSMPDTEDSRCEPVFLNDPVSPARGQWFSLIGISALNYAARQTLYDIINRAPVTAVSQLRGWASGEFTLLTNTLAERSMALTVLETGRILYFRNPDPAYPESNWYIAIGDVQEARLGNNMRRPERLWTVPWARVERPSGLIDSQSGRTWQNVYDDDANWLATRTKNADWLAVLGT